MIAWLRKLAFRIAPEEVQFARRKFPEAEGAVRQRLEQVGTFFLHGYHAALEEEEPEALALQLENVSAEGRGFAFEGAAMSLALQDHLLPWKRNRWRSFLEGLGSPHAYMIHVGLGWALARLPWQRPRFERALSGLDTLLRWLAIDGYGFHEGYFSWRRTIQGQEIPRGLSAYGRRVFDQGLGRSLWFVKGADFAGIARTIAAFHPARRSDLWSGVGLACTYAGGRGREEMESLCRASEGYQAQLAQGAAFAAKARERAGNLTPHTELACEVLCGLSAHEGAALTDAALEDMPPEGIEPAYETWRRRVQAHWFSFNRKPLASA